MTMPGSDRAIDLGPAQRAEMRPDRAHECHSGRAFDARYVWRLVMRASHAHRDDSTVDERADALDDVPVGHRHAHDRLTARGWWTREKGALAFEDADEPEEVFVVDDTRVTNAHSRVKGIAVMQSTGRLGGSDPPPRGPQPLVLPLHHSRRERQEDPVSTNSRRRGDPAPLLFRPENTLSVKTITRVYLPT